MSKANRPATGRTNARVRAEPEPGTRSQGHGRPSLLPLPPRDLAHCPRCDRNLVYPVAWESAGRQGWKISLRCPECEWTSGGLFTQEVADRFDDALDRGTQGLLDSLQALTQANMEQGVARFCEALHAGLILPEDF